MKLKVKFTLRQEFRLFLALGAVLLVFLLIALGSEGKKSTTPRPTPLADPFSMVTITAKAAYVYDVRTKEVLFAKNEKARLPLASLTKVMSALVASDIAGDKAIVTITPEGIKPEGDSGLLVGERWTMKNLLDFALITSSNDAIHAAGLAAGGIVAHTGDPAAAYTAFIHEMNAKADELQMKNTYYFNDTGLDESAQRGGAYGSAQDMAKLFEYVLSTHPDLLEATQQSHTSVTSFDKTHVAKNTDILTDLIPGLMASKTGFTDLAGGNLVIAFDPELGHLVIVSVLGSTESGRFQDVTTLVNAALKSLSTRDQNREE